MSCLPIVVSILSSPVIHLTHNYMYKMHEFKPSFYTLQAKSLVRHLKRFYFIIKYNVQ